MGAELALVIDFRAEGNSLGYLDGGWAQPEAGFTWAIGTESHVVLRDIAPDDDYVLQLDVIPFVHAPELPAQRIIVSVNGSVVGSSALSRPTLLGYRVPGHLLRGTGAIRIVLQHPDAVLPSEFLATTDQRQLAFSLVEMRLYRVVQDDADRAWRAPRGVMISGGDSHDFKDRPPADLAAWVAERTGLDLPALALQFESLGENCEYGLVQRRCESEPLGLLRFSSTFLRSLIRGLDDGFAGIGEDDDVDPRLQGAAPREFMVHEKKYGLVYHTFVYEGERSPWLMREQEAARLKFLRRKFLEELEIAEKIFIYKRNTPVPEEEILPLFLSLRRHGNNTLLWVVPAGRARPAGTVEVVMPGLLKGYIDRFATDENAHDFSFDGWLKVCANAVVLARLGRGAT